MSWEKDLERDLDWRLAELASLKTQAAFAANGSILQQGLLRSLIAMLYAHYEGFCKNAIRIYLREIRRRNTLRGDCLEELSAFSLRKNIRDLRGLENSDCFEFLQNGFRQVMAEVIDYEIDHQGEIVLDGESNMWADCLERNLVSVQLQCDFLTSHVREINSLVGRRNDIAHGQKLVISNLRQYEDIEQAVDSVMLNLSYSIIDGLERLEYLNRPGYSI